MSFSTFIAGCRRITSTPPASLTSTASPTGSEATHRKPAGPSSHLAGMGGRLANSGDTVDIHELMQSFGYGKPAAAKVNPKAAMPVTRSTMAKVRVSGVSRERAQAETLDPEAEGRRLARQKRQNAAAVETAREIARDERARAARIAAASTPEAKATVFAHRMLATAAGLRGESYDTTKFIAGPPQKQVRATADQILAAARKARGEA